MGCKLCFFFRCSHEGFHKAANSHKKGFPKADKILKYYVRGLWIPIHVTNSGFWKLVCDSTRGFQNNFYPIPQI
jgi:hypothetical protein